MSCTVYDECRCAKEELFSWSTIIIKIHTTFYDGCKTRKANEHKKKITKENRYTQTDGWTDYDERTVATNHYFTVHCDHYTNCHFKCRNGDLDIRPCHCFSIITVVGYLVMYTCAGINIRKL